MRPAEGPDVGGSPSGVARPRVAVVLAGRRGGPDALAEAAGAVHRALLEIEGQPMLVRVVERLLAWPSIEHVIVNIDAPELARAEPALARRVAAGEVTLLGSTASPSRSVLESLDAARLEHQPVLVTTADHALLDEHMLARFLEGAEAAAPDLAVALVSRRTIEARFPTARRTYLRFRDGAYSGANLFLFRTPAARRAALRQRVEQERKRPLADREGLRLARPDPLRDATADARPGSCVLAADRCPGARDPARHRGGRRRRGQARGPRARPPDPRRACRYGAGCMTSGSSTATNSPDAAS
ncbi:MAG: nucleotidyltransferase family protein [Myxococcota bacterium]